MWWTRHSIAVMFVYSSLLTALHYKFEWAWLAMPWQPISLLGTALAFYLGFKTNSAYGRLWEARIIWGGIVNASRSFTVMARDFILIDDDDDPKAGIRRQVVDRHIAWLHMLTLELRKLKTWEHNGTMSQAMRRFLGTEVKDGDDEKLLRTYVTADEAERLLRKGNRSSHLLSTQSKQLMQLRKDGHLDHFRHLEMQRLITEFYTLQGKSERIKNFPFPRQYASATYLSIFLFLVVLPLGMIDVFDAHKPEWFVFLAVPSSVVCGWVYWFMDRIGEYSENPFEGLSNDIPIKSMSRSIEIDILQMLDEEDLPPAIGVVEGSSVVV